jgi:hypothetical protein
MKSVTQLAGLVLFGAWLTSSAVAAGPGGFHGGGFHGAARAGANGRGAVAFRGPAGFRGSRGIAGRPGFVRGFDGRRFEGRGFDGRRFARGFRYDRHHHRFVAVGFYGYPFGFYDYGYPYGYGDGYPYGYDYDYYGYDPNYDYQAAANQRPAPAEIGVAVQSELARQGYYDGPLDGIIGDGSRRAIREYQRDHGLPVTGEITPELLDSMKLRPRG